MTHLAENSRRRWFQFRLRSLLLLVVLAGALFAAFRLWLEPYRRQRETMALIERLGGTYQTEAAEPWLCRVFGSDFQNITVVDLANCDQPDAHIQQISRLPCLRTLVVGGDNFTDRHLQRLQGLKAMRWLVSDCTDITEAGVQRLQRSLPGLKVHHSQRRSIATFAQTWVEDWWGEDWAWNAIREESDTELRPGDPDLARDIGDEYFRVAKHVGVQGIDFRLADTTPEDWHRRSRTALSILRHLEDVEDLELLYLETEKGDLAPLSRLKKLRVLSLLGTTVRDSDLQHLKDLPSLQDISLSGEGVADEGMAHLAGMSQLRRLDLEETGVGDAGLAHIAALTGLRELSLWNSQVTDAGLKHLATLRKLSELSLDWCKVGDAGLKQLAGLERLNVLRLSCTQVTDDSVLVLARFSSARHFDLRSTRITSAGIERLRKAAPRCLIQE